MPEILSRAGKWAKRHERAVLATALLTLAAASGECIKQTSDMQPSRKVETGWFPRSFVVGSEVTLGLVHIYNGRNPVICGNGSSREDTLFDSDFYKFVISAHSVPSLSIDAELVSLPPAIVCRADR